MYPKSFLENEEFEQEPWTCFVLMPFGEPYDEIYHEIIKEVLDENNYTTKRADEIYGSKPIMEDIIKGIVSSEIIIADLTDKNPNVFYELGISHTIKENDNVILLSQRIDDVPFDIRPYRILIYKPTITGAKALKKQLDKTLKEFRTKPIELRNFKFIPSIPSWYKSDEETLKAEIIEQGQLPLIFIKNPFQSEKLSINFQALSTGPEINTMFCTNGKDRFSGYHVWFWKGGLKLRRLDDELLLIKDYPMRPGFLHSVNIQYDNGNIKIIIDKKELLNFNDENPLDKNKKLKYVGFNIASSKGFVEYSEIEIK
ncbi:hypothetical protein JXM83_05225 [Candidatus Woesearchaeota archaeon]|nr:hypothetical protein [Candidatus Woesearchaeota archaeon]